MEETLKKAVSKALGELGIAGVEPELEHPADLSHGDYSTNAALVAEGNPRENAEKLVTALRQAQDDLNFVDKIEVAGPGFINFHLSRDFFTQSVENVDKDFGKSNHAKGYKVMVEYTDPNPLKEFHIGHLMSNTIGEALTRLFAFSGAEVKRANYYGDVGVHIAKAVWGKMQKPELAWGKAYAYGAEHYDEHKEEIDTLNKTLYKKSDPEVNRLYEAGVKDSLEVFEKIYKVLGTSFDFYFPESSVGDIGKKLVEENTGTLFEESDGALVFPEEKSGLHTRVFVNSRGLPTYEAKELGLAKVKYEKWPYDLSVVVTANEINEYFKVLLAAMERIYPELAEKTKHVGHGMMRLPSGKMSSRTGDVVQAMALINDVKARALERMEEKDEETAEKIAVAALKFSILKQAPGKDVIFDMEQSVSFEGDSGPYLQYTYVRTRALLEKARAEGITPHTHTVPHTVFPPEKLLYRFPEAVERAAGQYAPQLVAQYLLSLAAAFNAFYAEEKIVDKEDKHSPYKLALAERVGMVLENGLWLLGIRTVPRM